MSDFKFIQDTKSGKWLIMAPKRAKRPDQINGSEPVCPFEDDNRKVLLELNDVRVVDNIYPFAPIHEIIIHTSSHTKTFEKMTDSQAEDVFKVYRQRFIAHRDSGQAYIFNNHGEASGESLPHPHTQLVVIPNEVKLDIPALNLIDEEVKELLSFYLFCPKTSEWPDEVWVCPKKEGRSFSETTEAEVEELSYVVKRLIEIFDTRYNHDFPYNFYIYPGNGWYLRLIPRRRILGGFEVGTNVSVNTMDPIETMEFIKIHFDDPDFEKIKKEHLVNYEKGV